MSTVCNLVQCSKAAGPIQLKSAGRSIVSSPVPRKQPSGMTLCRSRRFFYLVLSRPIVRKTVLKDCFFGLGLAEHKGQTRKNAKAIRVPVTRAGQVLSHAFTHSSDIRHLQIEAGIHTIGEAAWQHCTRLLIVHLPSSLLCLKEGAFRCCYVLHTVTAPGCIDFGCWAFEECAGGREW